MAFDFPSPAGVGQVVTGPNNASWRYDGTKWLASATWQAASLVISDTPPANPVVGALWYDSVGLATYTWFNDGTSSQWTPVVNQGGITDAPTDGQYYTRRSGAWANVAQSPAVQNNTGRNLLHNGRFNVTQRGLGSWTGVAYTADRWQQVPNGSDTMSSSIFGFPASNSIGEDAITGLSTVVTGSAAGSSYSVLVQKIENIRRISGKQVTFSFWACVASGTAKLGMNVAYFPGSGGSPSGPVAFPFTQFVTLTTAWQRLSFTFTMPTSTPYTMGTNGDNFIQLGLVMSDGSNALGSGIGAQSGTFNLYGIQLEYGNVATLLAVRDPADDLALCQRFYQFVLSFAISGYGTANGQSIYGTAVLPVTMRATPTAVVTTSSGFTWTGTATVNNTNAGQVTLQATTIGMSGAQQLLNISNFTASADL